MRPELPVLIKARVMTARSAFNAVFVGALTGIATSNFGLLLLTCITWSLIDTVLKNRERATS